jgi:ATP-dependent DNA helicase RecQ
LTAALPASAARRTERGSREIERDDDADESLFDALRALRKHIADQRDVPAYVIFPDTTLRAMARDVPTTLAELRRIPGVGDKKLADYGDVFLSELARHRTRENAVESS